MSVALDAIGTADAYGNNVSSLDFSNLTVGSGSDRALVAVIALSSRSQTVSSVTWDPSGANQALTFIASADAPSTDAGHVELWGLVNPASGNKTLHVALTGSSIDCNVDAIALTGVDQTGGSTTFYHANSANGVSATAAVTVTSASGDAAVDVMTIAGSGTISGPAQTQIFIDGADPGPIAAAASYNLGSASVAFSWATGSSSAQWVDLGVAVKAAAGAGAFKFRKTFSQTGRTGARQVMNW